MHAVLVSNPGASRVTASSQRVAVRALEATFDLDVVATTGPGHAAALAREAVAQGAKAVIVHGGDGTMNEVVNGLLAGAASTEIILGLLPGGGTNVLARTLGYPSGLVEATDHLIGLVENGRVRRLGLGRLRSDTGERTFAFGAGLVLDGEAVRLVQETGIRSRLGDAGYFWCVLRSYARMRRAGGPSLTVQTPDGPLDAWWAIVSKSDPLTYLGRRGLRAAPRASHDLRLDVSAGLDGGVGRTLGWAARGFARGGQVRSSRYAYLHDVPSCSITARRPVPLQADGEFLGVTTALEAWNLPAALPVYAEPPA